MVMLQRFIDRSLSDTPFVLRVFTVFIVFLFSVGFFINQFHTMQTSPYADAQAITATFGTHEIMIRPDEVAKFNIFLNTQNSNTVSAAAVSLLYSANLLDYQPAPENQVMSDCSNNNFKLASVFKEKNNTTIGMLTVSRGALIPGSGLPSGLLCWGTIGFKPKQNIPLPAVAVIRFNDNAQEWEAVGPQTAFAPQFDTSKTITIRIANPTPTLAPSATPTVTPAPDTTPPEVSITSPVNGAIVPRNGMVAVQTNASDNRRLLRIELRVNNALLCTHTAPTNTCNWKVTGKPNAKYRIEAKAFDAAGNVRTVVANVMTAQ